MKALRFVALCLLLAGCQPKVITELRTETVYRDSVIVRDTTVYVPLPVEVIREVVAPADTSHLETSLAESWAWADSLGLHHRLENRRREWGVQLPKVTRIVAKAQESAQIRTIEKEVKRDFTWWEKVRLWAFTPLVLLCLVGWRKELIKFYKAIAHFFL